MNDGRETEPWSVWPLIYFDPQWSGSVYDCFGLGVKLVRADSDALNAMKKLVGNARFPGGYVFDSDVNWLLAIPVGEEFEYADSLQTGVSTREEVARALASTFLLCLRLVRPTPAICPVWFDAEVDADGGRLLHGPNGSMDYEDPSLDWDQADTMEGDENPEAFREGDLVVLVEVWDRLATSFSLTDLLAKGQSEAFWQAIDRKATHDVRGPLRDRFAQITDDPQQAERLMVTFGNENDPCYQEKHAAAFRTGLRAHMDETFLRATRIGRALSLFDSGFDSGPIGSFLLMCFALETLFTVEKRSNRRGITKKLTKRASKMVLRKGQDPQEEEERAKRVFKERGDIVHGSKGIDSVPAEIQRDAVDMARSSLRKILSCPKLLELYCGEDMGKLRDFFRNLDRNREWGGVTYELKQFVLTPSMSKRLIGKGIIAHPSMHEVLDKGTLVIVAGTTNGYVAEEILDAIDQRKGFTREGFRRGIVVPPGKSVEAGDAVDVVITDGVWQKGLTIFDVADSLKAGDVILKGANALSCDLNKAAVLIGHPQVGTMGAAMPAVIGRRAQLIVPVGLEKRVCEDIDALAEAVNAPDAEGPRLLPMSGETFTEIDAIETLTGADAFLVAAGGIRGAEGAVWIAVQGENDCVAAAQELIQSVQSEPPCAG